MLLETFDGVCLADSDQNELKLADVLLSYFFWRYPANGDIFMSQLLRPNLEGFYLLHFWLLHF